jgi:hypothetical protein
LPGHRKGLANALFGGGPGERAFGEAKREVEKGWVDYRVERLRPGFG